MAKDGRWPAWKLGLLLYPFSAGAVAINLFLLGLMAQVVGWEALSPRMSLWGGAILGVPATYWAGAWVRRLIDRADGP